MLFSMGTAAFSCLYLKWLQPLSGRPTKTSSEKKKKATVCIPPSCGRNMLQYTQFNRNCKSTSDKAIKMQGAVCVGELTTFRCACAAVHSQMCKRFEENAKKFNNNQWHSHSTLFVLSFFSSCSKGALPLHCHQIRAHRKLLGLSLSQYKATRGLAK